ncbi:MAG: cytochrome c [Gammaproteobacteria bacterium]|nr:cytochrome c [Gammaproteobacteria bacterium]
MLKHIALLIALNFTMISLSYSAETAEVNITADELKVATKIYKTYCSKCHGKTGKGDGRMNRLYIKLQINAPSNFTIGYFEDRPAEYLKRLIRDGGEKNSRGKHMPPFAEELSDEKIDLLVKLIQETGKLRSMPK